MPEVEVRELTRRYRRMDRSRGLFGALRDLLRADEEHLALDRVSFSIEPGEAVALLGPNGAGKSTTVKLLTGILVPTSGRVSVGGLDPWADRKRHVRRIGVVFGQRSQLWWDLAVIEAYDLLAAMFGVPDADYKARLRRFDEVLGVGPLLRTPVRQLSLGERMRCELAAALLHDPPLLFLDEPTVGLDVAVKLRLRAFLAEIHQAGRTTILLTTHDLSDVRALCPRVLLLGQGRLLHDGPLEALARRLGGRRVLTVDLRSAPGEGALAALPAAERVGPLSLRFPVPDEAGAAELVRAALAALDVADLRLDDPPIEELVARFYEGERAGLGGGA